MQETIEYLIDYGYVILFVYSFGGGMIALLGAGLLAALGKLNLLECMLVAGIANFLGDMVLFYMARYNKTAILPYFSRYRRKLALAQILFKRHGAKIIFFKKYIYGLKTLVPLAIGISKFDIKRFGIINFICSAIWAASVGFVGYYSGEAVKKFAEIYGDQVWLSLGIFVIILSIIWAYFSAATKKNNKHEL